MKPKTTQTQPPSHPPLKTQAHREILNLALPALATLLAQPLFTTIDSAMVGHLGTHPLAGLALGSTIISTVFGLCIFLAYSTTAITAKHFGAGNPQAGMKSGIDALWLALLLGILLTLILTATAPQIIQLFNPSAAVTHHAIAYLTWVTPGLIGMLLALAATGTLRGLLDTRTPLIVASVGAAVNTILNYLLIYSLNLGIAGSALGTSLTEIGMGLALTLRVLKAAHPHKISYKPDFTGIISASLTGAPLIIRTLAMRACLFFTVFTLTRAGDYALAGNQIVTTVWNFAAFALDALAIAAQALIGRSLGANRHRETRVLLRILISWGLAAGTVLGLLVAFLSPWLPRIFTADQHLLQITAATLLVSAPFYLLAGYVFILDGVLIGAGDNRFLALASVLVMGVYLPALFIFDRVYLGSAVAFGLATQRWSLVVIWLLFGGFFIGGRALSLLWRSQILFPRAV